MRTTIKIIAVIMCGILVGGLIFGLTNLSERKSSNSGTETTVHTHTYSSKYSYNTEKHWRVASCGHDLVTEQETHNFGSGDTCKCGYKKPQDEETDHVHTYSSTYCYNTVQHWKVAICGHDLVTEQEAHDFGEGNTCKCGFTTTSDVSSMKAVYHIEAQKLNRPSSEVATEEQIEQFNKAEKQVDSTLAASMGELGKCLPIVIMQCLVKQYYYGVYLTSENVFSVVKPEYVDNNYSITMVSLYSFIPAANMVFYVDETYTPYEELAKFMNMVFGVTYEVVYVADNLEE